MQSYFGTYIASFAYIPQGDGLLLVMGLFLVAVFLVKSFFGVIVNYKILQFCYNQGFRIRSLLMRSYQNMPYKKYISRNSSEYIHNIQVVSDKFSIGILQSILRIMSEGIVVVFVLMFLLWSSPQIVALLLVLFGFVMLIYNYLFGKKMQRYGKISNKHSNSMIRGIHEGINGFKEVRILGKEAYFYTKFISGAEGLKEANLRSTHISLLPRYLLELVLIVFIVLLVNGSMLFNQNIDNLIPILGMFGVATVRLIPSINRMMTGITMIRFGKNFVDILYKDVKKSFHLNQSDRSPIKQKDIDKFNSLDIKDLHFSYPKTSRGAINDISITVHAGESIGFIGSSGSGKTTLIDLILGLHCPNSGEINVNGSSISDNILKWRSRIAYIPQQIFLIDDTLCNNIALSDPSKIDDVKLKESIKKAHLEELVRELESGIETVVGENGIQLSGGQRQRIALARAFYHDRDIIIMDEATSALDGHTESEIIDEIQQLKGKKTVIVIAHRLSTVQHCDRIYELNKGRLVDFGSPEKMLN